MVHAAASAGPSHTAGCSAAQVLALSAQRSQELEESAAGGQGSGLWHRQNGALYRQESPRDEELDPLAYAEPGRAKWLLRA